MKTYRTVFLLSQKEQKHNENLEGLGIKWMIFLLFLKFEPSIAAVLEIIPLGTLLVLAIKCILVLPENALAMVIYKKLEKQL
jgi:hypothetical protein